MDGSADGFGVRADGADSLEIDGTGDPDTLRFEFSQSITLTQVVFTNIDFHAFAEDQTTITNVTTATEIFNGTLAFGSVGGTTTRDIVANNLGSIFTIEPNDSDDDFRIQSITFDSEVPEPSTYTLMAIGLAAIALLRRRSRAKP